MKFTYSIIIPHRDSLELLKRALSSVPDRSDIQIIVIDNTSDKIDFSTLEERENSKLILLYSNIDKGAGHARNVGIKEAEGKWLLFLDADDFYNPAAFEHFDKYIDSEYDIIYFSVTSVILNTLVEAERHKYYKKLVSDFVMGKEKAEDNLRYWFTSPWSKLIRRKLIHEKAIQFEEVPTSNDLMFSIKSGHFAYKIWAEDFPVYCVTFNKGSLTQTNNKRNSRSRFCASIRQYQFMSSIGRPELRFRLMASVLKSFQFGIKEFLWYISTAYKERVNIFLGIHRWPNVIYRYICYKKRKRQSIFVK